MCGICGILGYNDRNLVRKMARALQHRGPDDEGFFSDKNIELANRRLSIIDVKGGHQPIHNEDKTIWVVYNGEIYNHKQLRRTLEPKHSFATNSDTEVLVHLYEEHGLDFVKMLNGIFAFALYDVKKKRVILARDRIGTKPLYYSYTPSKKLLFASELKALLQAEEIPRKTNLARMKEYIQFGYITSPNTFLQDVHKLQPGEMLIWNTNKKTITKKQYWDFTFKEVKKSTSFYKEEFFKTFKSCVNDQLMSEVPLGVYLSGGLDSSSIVAMIKQLYPQRQLTTFSVGFNSKEVINELNYAEKVASFFNTNHKEIIVESNALRKLPEVIHTLDEPINNLSALPLYHMAQAAAKKVSVILTGNGSDELFGGYMQHRFMNFALRNKAILRSARPFLALQNAVYPHRKTLFLQKFTRQLDKPHEAYKLLKSPEPDPSFFHPPHSKKLIPDTSIKELLSKPYSLVNRLTLIELKKLLPENYLMVDDKINMHFSIESRVPYLDNRMVALSQQLPSYLKTSLTLGKIILRKAMNERLPKEILRRKKYGFTAPATAWFNTHISSLKTQLLAQSPVDEFLDKSNTALMIQRRSTADLNQLWNILVVNIWSRQYLWKEKIEKI